MTDGSDTTPGAATPAGKPFIGVHMKCCNTYTRAYLVADRSRFEGRCLRCGAFVRIPVSQDGGSTSRFFEAS